jgi:hypothetical protein
VPATVETDYTVTNAVSSISLHGHVMLSFEHPCNDCPYAFVHLDVRAERVPALVVRVSEVELCWDTASDQFYQVQYNSDLTTNTWTDLGTPIEGDGSTRCIQDRLADGSEKRIYRVILAP